MELATALGMQAGRADAKAVYEGLRISGNHRRGDGGEVPRNMNSMSGRRELRPRSLTKAVQTARHHRGWGRGRVDIRARSNAHRLRPKRISRWKRAWFVAGVRSM